MKQKGPNALAYLVQILLMGLPWRARRRILAALFGFDIDRTARIGFSIVAPRTLKLAHNSEIGHLNVIRGMDLLDLGAGAIISHLNWVFGIASRELGSLDGPSALILDAGAGITRRHLIDCSAPVRLGKFCLVAGYGSQILTHAVVLAEDHQGAKAIGLGDYAFVGTRSVVLGGATLPRYSALGAGSTLRDRFEDEYSIYSGVPAKLVGKTKPDSKFFFRSRA